MPGIDDCIGSRGAATATSTAVISGRTTQPRLPFQGKRAGVTWLLYVDSPGGHWSERLRVVRGVESYDNLTELSDDEAVTAARAACHQRLQRDVVVIRATPVEGEVQTATTAAAAAAAAEIPTHSLRSKVPPRTKTKKTKPAHGVGAAVSGGGPPHPMERSLDDMLFAVSNHGSFTRRPMHSSAAKPVATTTLGKSTLVSTTDDEATEENDSLFAVMELNSLPSGTDDSSHRHHHGDGISLRITAAAMPPPRTTSLNTALSEDDTIVGSDRWSVASCNTTTPLTTLTLGSNETNHGWDAVEIPGLWATTRTDELDEMGDDAADTDECNLLGEADEYWSSLCHKGKEELEQRLDGVNLNDDSKASKKLSSTYPSKTDTRDATKGRPSATTPQDETFDKRKSRRAHTRRSEEDKAALTSSDEDQLVAGDAPRLSHKRASQKGGDSDKATSGAAGETHRSPSKRLDKKSEGEKKQGRPKKDVHKPTKSIDLEGITNSLEVGLSIPSHLQDSTFAFADEDQSIDPLANFSQRRPLQRLLSPPGKTRPKQDQSLIARVTISPRKQRREAQPFQTTAEDGSQSDVSSGSEEEEGKSNNRRSNPYLEQSRRREGATSSGELNAGAVPTQHSLDQNAYSTGSLQISESGSKGRAENSESTIGAEFGAAYPNRKTLQLLERSATSSGDESSESNTSGYSFGAGLRHLNPNINLNGILDAKAKGQFVQLNLEGKAGVQVVDSLHVRSEHRSGLHQRKVIPDSYLARSFSQITYDETATEKVSDDFNRSSMGKMLSDMNMKNFRRSTGSTNKQTKFADNLLAFGGRRSKNAENMMAPMEPEGDHHEGKKFLGRNSLQKSRSDRLLLVDKDDESEP